MMAIYRLGFSPRESHATLVAVDESVFGFSQRSGHQTARQLYF